MTAESPSPRSGLPEVLQAHVTEIVFDGGSAVEPECILCQRAAAAGMWDRWYDLDDPEEAQQLAELKRRAARVICPHCGDAGLDKGAIGMDLCTRCGGLSRDGHPLRRRQGFQVFGAPLQVELRYARASGVLVAAVVLEDGSTGIAVTYVLDDGKRLPPLVVAGELADNFARLVDNAHKATQRTRN